MDNYNSFKDILDGSAVAQEHPIANSRRICHNMVPPDVAEARCASRSAVTAAEKKKRRKEERHLTRRWRAEWILRRGSKAKAILRMDKLECNGVVTVYREKWKTEVEGHCRRTYEDENMSLPDALAEVQVLRDFQAKSGEPPRIFVLRTWSMPNPNCQETKQVEGAARQLMSGSKNLPAVVLRWLLIVFCARLRGQAVETMKRAG